MGINDLSATLAVLLAVSLATERLVAVVKTALPTWFSDEKKTEAGEVDLLADRGRRLRVQGVAFLCAWITAGFLADAGGPSAGSPGAYLSPLVGTVYVGTLQMPTVLVALLASGGSAFWAQLVGYAGNAKDLVGTRKAAASLAFVAQARETVGVTPVDGGGAAVDTRRSHPVREAQPAGAR